MIGFSLSCGTDWCYRTENGYQKIARVYRNGQIKWYMEDISEEDRIKIFKSAARYLNRLNEMKKELRLKKEALKKVERNTAEYFNLLHSVYWHMDELAVIN